MIRWIFTEVDTGDSYTVEYNPNKMTSPFRGNNTTLMIENLGYRRREGPVEWSFGGIVRTKQSYDDLLAWSQKPGVINVRDHLGRTFACLLLEFVPDEKTPTAHVAWRFDYTMRAMVLNYLGVT